MNILSNLEDMLGQAMSGMNAYKDADPSQQQTQGAQGGLANIFGSSGILGPAVLGGLAGALLSSKAARGIAGGALLAGGGSMLWDKLQSRIRQENKDNPAYSETAASAPEDRAERLITALVFAAKSDGHIDEQEQQKINMELQKLNLGPKGEELVQKAMATQPDPAVVAKGVKNADEAIEVYTLSCAVMAGDGFMQRSYMEGLAKALNIPDDIKKSLEAHLSANNS